MSYGPARRNPVLQKLEGINLLLEVDAVLTPGQCPLEEAPCALGSGTGGLGDLSHQLERGAAVLPPPQRPLQRLENKDENVVVVVRGRQTRHPRRSRIT